MLLGGEEVVHGPLVAGSAPGGSFSKLIGACF
jgi:hypothetical protein